MAERTIVLVAPDDLSWAAVRLLLRSTPDVELLGDATGVSDALELEARRTPHAIVSAPSVDQRSTLPLLQELTSRWPGTRILVLIDQHGWDDLDAYASLPGSSCIRWNDLTLHGLQHCLLAALDAPLRIFSDSVVEGIPAPVSLLPLGAAAELTPRALAVLEGLAAGLTEPQVASREGISLRTVKRTIADLESRFEAPTLFALALVAERLGLLPRTPMAP